jgi:hypothetical protein
MKVRPLYHRGAVKHVENEEKPKSSTIVIDTSYIREQANSAIKTFVAPLSGVYAAAFGPISPGDEMPAHENKKP